MDTTTTATETEVRTSFTIPAANIGVLEAKIAKLAARARRLGCPEPALVRTGTIERPATYPLDHPLCGLPIPGRIERFVEVTVTGEAPSYNGWSLAAVIEMDHEEPETPNVVDVITGEADPAWRTLTERCDHCHVDNRRRNKLVVVDHEDGDRKVIGTTCLRDFLGHQSPENIAARAEWVADLVNLGDDDELYGSANHAELRYETETYLAWVARACTESGWVSRSAAYHGQDTATADVAAGLFAIKLGLIKVDRHNPMPEDLTAAELAEATAALTWAQAQEPTNDYLANLNAVALKASLGRKHLGVAASIIPGYRRAVEREITRKAEAQATAASTHVGTVGERIELTGTVTFIREFPGDYGTRALVKILADGNLLTWWCSDASKAPEQGQTVTGKATVKAHEDYQGTAQTLITRAKLTVAE